MSICIWSSEKDLQNIINELDQLGRQQLKRKSWVNSNILTQGLEFIVMKVQHMNLCMRYRDQLENLMQNKYYLL